MQIIVESVLIILLALIAYQDFRHRAVWWMLFLLAFVASAFYSIIHSGNENAITYSGINFVTLLTEFLFLTAYFSIKKGRFENILNTQIGLGDVLFLIIMCPLFHPVVFVIFQITGLFLVLMGSGAYVLFKKNKQYPIPLAGFLSLYLIIFVVFNIAGRISDSLATMIGVVY